MLNFEEIKAIRLTDVVLRYGIPLKYRGEWATGNCPLPSHDSKSKGTFAVNVKENYWVCHSESCRAKSGKKGGDVISFVALKEGMTDKNAALKLAQWFNIKPNKEAAHIERPASEGQKEPAKEHQNNTSSSDSGKGYIHAVDAWLEELTKQIEGEDDAAFWKRVKNGIKGKLIESFRNGQRKAQGLPLAS